MSETRFIDTSAETVVIEYLSQGLDGSMAKVLENFPDIRREWFTGLAPAWIAANDLHGKGRPVSCVTLAEILGENGLKSVGGAHVIVPGQHSWHLVADCLQRLQALAPKRAAIPIIKQASDGLLSVAETIAALEPLAVPPGSNKLTFRTISEILKMEFSDDDLYLRNGYLQRGGSLSIFGAGGIGKSRLAMQLAICSAAGLPFLGWETQGKPKWLFLQTENGNRRLQHDLSRMTSLCDEGDLAKLDEKIVFHTIENRFDRLLRPSNDKSASRMVSAMKYHNPDVVVIDVLRDFAIGDINSDEGMTDTLEAIEGIVRADRPDRAIVIVHHARTGKAASAGAYGMDRANFGRNSKVLLGWSRAVLNVAQLSESDDGLIGVASGKNNDFREIEPIAVRLNPEHMVYVVDKDVDVAEQIATLTDTKKKEPKATAADVLTIVEARHPSAISRVDIAKELIKSRGVSNATAYRVISEAETQKSIKLSSKLGGFFSPSKISDEKDLKAA